MIKISKTRELGKADLAAITRQYGEMPEDYKDFVQKHNGAYLSPNFVDGTGGMASIRRFIPVGEIPETSRLVEGLDPSLMPIAEDGSGNFICFDLNNSNVVFWDHEIEGGVARIASSFTELLSLLKDINLLFDND
jgi:hypothetical protein